MLLCNTSVMKDWTFFLSQILPLVNRSSGLMQQIDSPMLPAAEPDLAGVSASRPPLNSDPTSGLEHVSRYSPPEDELLDRTPPNASIPLPKALFYLVAAALVVVALAYAIVGHLVKDLVHECIDWVFGPHSVNNVSKRDVNCITSSMNEMADLPSAIETNFISLGHTNCLYAGIPEDERSQLPREAYSGT